MTPEQEKQFLEVIYDRLYDAITYQPSGGKNPFTHNETFIHFSKNAAVKTVDYKNLVTPTNPSGNLKASEAFSRMVDKISPMSLEWDTQAVLSETYVNIVKAANSDFNSTNNDGQRAKYDEAFNYLNVTRKISTGDVATTDITDDSNEYKKYKENLRAYTNALVEYRSEYLDYLDALDANDSRADRRWQIKAIKLEQNIKDKYDNLISGNSVKIEKALDILQTTINDGIAAALTKAKELVSDKVMFKSSIEGQSPWLFSYPEPANWADGDLDSFTSLKIDGSSLKTRSEESQHKFKVDASYNAGLWKVSANVDGKFKNLNTSSDAQNTSISAKIAKVNIVRPWFMESLFRLKNWSTNLGKPVSNGKIDSSNKDNLLPMIPVAFIIAKDIEIKTKLSAEERELIQKEINAGASVGWGPFSISGSYGYSSSDDKFKSQLTEGGIKIDGMQIIGWVSKVIPECSASK